MSCRRIDALIAAVVVVAASGAARADDPAGVDDHVERATALHRAGEHCEALAHFQWAHDLSGEPRHFYSMAYVLFDLGDYAAAAELFERYLAAGPSEEGAKLARAALTEATARRERGTEAKNCGLWESPARPPPPRATSCERLAALQETYETTRAPQRLAEIAAVLADLHDYRAAIAAWELYRRDAGDGATPVGARLESARARLPLGEPAACGRWQAQGTPPPVPAPDPPETTDPARPGTRTGPENQPADVDVDVDTPPERRGRGAAWSVTASGAGLAIAGATLAVVARRDIDDARAADDYDEAASLRDRAIRRRNAGIAVASIGAAAAATGLVFVLRRRGTSRTEIAPSAAGADAGVTVLVRF